MAVTIFSAVFDASNNLNVSICCHYDEGCHCPGDTPEHYSYYERIPSSELPDGGKAWVQERMKRWLEDAAERTSRRKPIQELVQTLIGLSSDGIDRIP